MNDEQIQSQLMALAEAKDGRAYNLEHRKLVLDCLHDAGSKRQRISHDQFVKAYLLCNGFGDIGQDDAYDQCFDFSHVRDSSPNGIERCAAYLKTLNL